MYNKHYNRFEELETLKNIVEEKANKQDIDGQWVNTGLKLLFSGKVLGQTPLKIDLSSYLPQDNYKYLCCFNMNITGTPGWPAILYGENNQDGVALVACSDVNNIQNYNRGQVIIGTDRIVYAVGYGQQNAAVSLLAYRRLGKNQ